LVVFALAPALASSAGWTRRWLSRAAQLPL